MKLIQLTDTHLVARGHALYGPDPRTRLDAAVADINRGHCAIALIETGSVVVHMHDYLDRSPRFSFPKPGVDDCTYAFGSFV